MRIIFKFGENQNDWDSIEKAFSHKYIKRVPKPTGKGWYYIYTETFKKPFKALAEIFGIKESRVNANYEKENISKDYGVDKQTFAAHILEYFTNKEKWNKIFGEKENRDKYKKPRNQKDLSEKKENTKDKTKTKKEGNTKKGVINRSLMRKVWSLYNTEAKAIEKKDAEQLETKEDGTDNRSAAMQGNKNAEKDNIKTENVVSGKENDNEIAKTKAARKEIGLPDIGNNAGERVSVIDDLISLNPNDANYAYKDTGYIAGSQKEKIQDFWARKKLSGESVDVEEIDWNALEENPRYSEQMIVKSNILGKTNYDKLREDGMKPTAAYFIDRIYAVVGKNPVHNTLEGRKNYVLAISSLKERLESCKTVHDIGDVIEDIHGELTQDFDSQISKDKAYSEALKEVLEIRSKSSSILDKVFHEINTNGKGKNIKELEKLAADLIREKVPTFDKETVPLERQVILGSRYIKFYQNPKLFEEEENAATEKLRKIRSELREKLRITNTTKDIWSELGEKFVNIRRSDTYKDRYKHLVVYEKKTFTNPNTGKEMATSSYSSRNKKYDIYDTWDWVDKEPERKAKDKSDIIEKLSKRKFEIIVPSTYEREGGKDVSVKTTQELKEMFNFRDIQTGTYVQTDPVSAKWHVDNIAAGLSDLSDMTGIPEKAITMNGRLALSIGARGHGKALAHYEPVQRVINITKFKGGGSLGHEWFHSFDNMIAESMNGGDYNQFLTNPELLRGKELPANEMNTAIKESFDNLVKAMIEGDTPETMTVEYKPEDYKSGKYLFENSSFKASTSPFTRFLVNSKNLDDAMKVINDYFGKSIKIIKEHGMSKLPKFEQKKLKKIQSQYNTYTKYAVAYFDGNEAGNIVDDVQTGNKVSRFYEDSKVLDAGKTNNYWSTTHEMAARAFEAYLTDKLKEQNRKNDYLSGHADNKEYAGVFYPYPTELDRKKINSAFDKLFETIKKYNAIQKALAILENRKPWCYFSKDGRLYFKKSTL